MKQMSQTKSLYKKGQLSLVFEIITNKEVYQISQENQVFKNPKSIYHYAITGNFQRFLQELIKLKNIDEKRDKQGRTILYMAARCGFTTICRMLLERGVDINAKCDKSQSTALHGATCYNQKDVVKLLLLNGADTTICNALNATAI